MAGKLVPSDDNDVAICSRWLPGAGAVVVHGSSDRSWQGFQSLCTMASKRLCSREDYCLKGAEMHPEILGQRWAAIGDTWNDWVAVKSCEIAHDPDFGKLKKHHEATRALCCADNSLSKCGDADVRISPDTLLEEGKPMYPEVFFQDSWHPICGHNFWDNNEGATTVCLCFLMYDVLLTRTQFLYHVGLGGGELKDSRAQFCVSFVDAGRSSAVFGRSCVHSILK